jgi:hypothetical protein
VAKAFRGHLLFAYGFLLREDYFRFPVMHLLRWGVSALMTSRGDEGVVLSLFVVLGGGY